MVLKMIFVSNKTIFIVVLVLLAVGGLIMLVLHLAVKAQGRKAKKLQKNPLTATIYSVVKQENGKNVEVRVKTVDGKKPEKVRYFNGYGVYMQPGQHTLELAQYTQIIDPASKIINLPKLNKESSVTFVVEAGKVYTLQFDADGHNYYLTEGFSPPGQ